jgi:PilZ domain
VEEVIDQAERLDKRIHIALPIRVTQWDAQNRPRVAMACTYDISPFGARVTGLPDVKTGDIIAIERGRAGKFFCRVVWVGEQKSELHGQVGIEGIEIQKVMWESELESMDEVFDPLPANHRSLYTGLPGQQVRRSAPRFEIEGFAELQQMNTPRAGIKNLSETGCLLITNDPLPPKENVKILLQVAPYDMTVKGSVRHVISQTGMGIEFSEIRKGDRQVLKFLLRKLAEKQFEKSFQLEM